MSAGNPPELTVHGLPTDNEGILSYSVHSVFQAEPTLIRLLVPRSDREPVRAVVFILPVEPGSNTAFGDGLRSLQALKLHDSHHVLVAAPTFSDLPWLADHPTDPLLRQEQYLMKHVLPFVEHHYPSVDTRLLLGFSKSGYGGCALLLRHLDIFQAAAVWDVPFMKAKPDAFGMAQIYGTDANFAAYRIPDLLHKHADQLRGQTRLAIFGYKLFCDHISAAHELLNRLGIPHQHANHIERDHRWDSGWLPDAFEALMQMK